MFPSLWRPGAPMMPRGGGGVWLLVVRHQQMALLSQCVSNLLNAKMSRCVSAVCKPNSQCCFIKRSTTQHHSSTTRCPQHAHLWWRATPLPPRSHQHHHHHPPQHRAASRYTSANWTTPEVGHTLVKNPKSMLEFTHLKLKLDYHFFVFNYTDTTCYWYHNRSGLFWNRKSSFFGASSNLSIFVHGLPSGWLWVTQGRWVKLELEGEGQGERAEMQERLWL